MQSQATLIKCDARFPILEIVKVLLRNKLDKAGEDILYDNKAKNTGIAIATTRLFNEVSVQKNKPEWSSYFVTMPKAISVNQIPKTIGTVLTFNL